MYTIFDEVNAQIAPDATVRDAGGRPVQMSSIWPQSQLTGFVFSRHFG